MSGLWQHLGFTQNPYFATPIEISNPGRDLFVGRGAEILRMINKWDEPGGCTTIIGGNIGTGKTSFLNVCQYLCLAGIRDFKLPYDPPRLVPAYEKVQLMTEGSDHELLLRILRTSAESLISACKSLDLEVPREAREVATWLRSIGEQTQTEMGFGASYNGTGAEATFARGTANRAPASVTTDALVAKLSDLATAATETGVFRGFIVAIDNIEMVPSDRIITLVNQYRDTLFDVPGIWWTLIGQKGLFDLIDAEIPRVSQRIKGTETTLEGLSWDDFHLAIQVRIDSFKLRDDASPPIGEQMLRTLFEASAGEIRYVFKMADQIVTDALAENPTLKDVDPGTAETILKQSVHEQISRLSLNPKEKKVALEIYHRNGVRPREYKELGFQNAPNLIQGVLQPLQEKGVVSKSTQGNAAVYSLRPLGILAAQFALLG